MTLRRDLPRREFVKRAALASAAPFVLSRWSRGDAGPLAAPRVVHAHHARSTLWSRVTSAYRDEVDQAAVDLMLDEAVRTLKGGSLDEAWRGVFPEPDNADRTLAIKINCNNATDAVDGAGTEIDAIPQPVISVIHGFVRAGGRSANCNVYDATNTAPNRYIAEWFREKVRAYYPDVQFNATGLADDTAAAFDPRTHVTWDPAYVDPPPETKIARAALESDYLVNVPIVKRHGQANVTLGYKNHLGSIDRADRLHPWLFNDVPEASVLADIMGSPVVPSDPSVRSIAQKTALTVGDMLFGQPCRNWGVEPRPWQIFANEWPGSLIVSDDPVAADCVMLDLLAPEPPVGPGCGSIQPWARRYLQHAADKGQGVYETVALPWGAVFDPTLMTYTQIDYRWLDLWPSGADLRASRVEGGRVLLEWEHYFPNAFCEVRRSTDPAFTSWTVLGATETGKLVDPAPPEPAFYRVYYAGD